MFYTLTHFGVEKQKKKLTWLRREEEEEGGEEGRCLQACIRRGDQRLGGRSRELIQMQLLERLPALT